MCAADKHLWKKPESGRSLKSQSARREANCALARFSAAGSLRAAPPAHSTAHQNRTVDDGSARCRFVVSNPSVMAQFCRLKSPDRMELKLAKWTLGALSPEER
ncbi:MAG: hypothetical protein DI640_06585 [Sphingomonas taxi]|uniref:Uncharacterized protein n=1 Tax=Sphingomonas taxi TaxID=1549858 RepID=A0A2W4Z359_9SPHN|nr:MAG: hypothetical protein DI640_06585 [Sphingomonas taxi]